MSIEAIAALSASAASNVESAPLALSPRADFGRVVGQGLDGVNQALATADQQLRVLASGQEIAPHDVMISMEEARMSLMLLTEVRNRLVEAYQEFSRMQL